MDNWTNKTKNTKIKINTWISCIVYTLFRLSQLLDVQMTLLDWGIMLGFAMNNNKRDSNFTVFPPSLEFSPVPYNLKTTHYR